MRFYLVCLFRVGLILVFENYWGEITFAEKNQHNGGAKKQQSNRTANVTRPHVSGAGLGV